MDSYDAVEAEAVLEIANLERKIRGEDLQIACCAARSRLYGKWKDEAIMALRKYRNSKEEA